MAIKIFIDQGHNPTNPNAGAEGNGYREQDLVYPIGIALADLLNDNPNFEARTSRNSPDEVLGTSNASSLAARVNAANEWGADAFSMAGKSHPYRICIRKLYPHASFYPIQINR